MMTVPAKTKNRPGAPEFKIPLITEFSALSLNSPFAPIMNAAKPRTTQLIAVTMASARTPALVKKSRSNVLFGGVSKIPKKRAKPKVKAALQARHSTNAKIVATGTCRKLSKRGLSGSFNFVSVLFSGLS